jgi:hypothetical protein
MATNLAFIHRMTNLKCPGNSFHKTRTQRIRRTITINKSTGKRKKLLSKNYIVEGTTPATNDHVTHINGLVTITTTHNRSFIDYHNLKDVLKKYS